MTIAVFFSALVAAIAAIQLMLDGRSLIGLTMAVTSGGIVLSGVGTWVWLGTEPCRERKAK